MLLFLFVILAIAEAVWNRDGGQLLRSTGQDVPTVMFLALRLMFMTTMGLAVADDFSIDVHGPVRRQHQLVLRGDDEASPTGWSFGAGVLVIVLVALFLPRRRLCSSPSSW